MPSTDQKRKSEELDLLRVSAENFLTDNQDDITEIGLIAFNDLLLIEAEGLVKICKTDKKSSLQEILYSEEINAMRAGSLLASFAIEHRHKDARRRLQEQIRSKLNEVVGAAGKMGFEVLLKTLKR